MTKTNRRGHGESSVYQRADGRWTAQIDLGWAEGKRRRKWVYGASQAEAIVRLREAKRLHDAGVLHAGRRQTVEGFLITWLRDSAKPSLRPKTADDYERIITRAIVPEIGRVALDRLTPALIQQMYRKWSATLSARTVRYRHAVLHRALDRAMHWNLIPRNPAAVVDVPRSVRTEFRPLTTAQTVQFLEVARNHRMAAFWTLAVYTGMRQGELLGLRWSDVDFDLRRVHVVRSVQMLRGVLIVGDTKTKQSRRAIPLSDEVVSALRAWRVRQMEEFLALGLPWSAEGYVFTSDAGTPWLARNVVYAFKRLLRTAALPDIRFHDLRHGAASLLLAENVHPKAVQELLGHSQIAMTMDLYSHLMHGQKVAAMDSLARRLAT